MICVYCRRIRLHVPEIPYFSRFRYTSHLGSFYVDYYVQCKAYERELASKRQQEEEDATDESNEENDVEMEDADEDRFVMRRNVTVEQQPALVNRVSEAEKRTQDTQSAKNEFDGVIVNWCDYKVPWKELFTEKELNWIPGQTKIDVYNNLWGVAVSM